MWWEATAGVIDIAEYDLARIVTKAALDAQRLADALAAEPNDLAAALTHYETDRLAYGRQLVAHGRWLGDTLIGQPGAPSAASIARRSEIMLRDYGALVTTSSAD